jgi:hypothetical protein
MMTRNRVAASLAGLTAGVICILSAIASGYAAADSPWDRYSNTCRCSVSNLSLLDAGLVSTSGTDDSPWD